jgi:CO/xanthine dehydrogenase FAD-binding subunit
MPSPNPMVARADVPDRSDIEVHQATRLKDALELMAEGAAEGKPWMPIAGGTDLMVWITQRRVVPERVIDIWNIDGIRGIQETEGSITLGALTSYAEVRRSEVVAEWIPPLADAARWCGAAQIQSRGTLGGNIAGSSPAGDTLPVFSAWDAELTLVSTQGARVVKFTDFYTGYRENLLQPDELILRIAIPKPAAGSLQVFHKVGTRRAQSISKVMLGFRGHLADDGSVGDVGISFGSVAPTVLRLNGTEALVRGKHLDAATIDTAVQIAGDEVVPIDDVRSTANYRRTVSRNLVRRYLTELSQS